MAKTVLRAMSFLSFAWAHDIAKSTNKIPEIVIERSIIFLFLHTVNPHCALYDKEICLMVMLLQLGVVGALEVKVRELPAQGITETVMGPGACT